MKIINSLNLKLAIILSLFILLQSGSGLFAQTTVTIGTGTLNQRQPFGPYWGYERSASIYTQTEIGSYGIISELGWQVATAQTTVVPTKIYLKTTASATLTADTWANMISGATLVYDASETFSATGWHTIDITNFSYTVNNLLVLCETNYTGTGIGTYAMFNYTSTTSAHLQFAQDNTPPTTSGTVNANRPNINITSFLNIPCTTPSNGPADLIFTSASTNISGTYTPVFDADSYLIIYSTSSTLSQNPVDGVIYSNGSTLGNGTVWGYTSTNSFNVTGLTPSTLYYFYIFSNNKNCIGGPLYNVIKPLMGNISTLISNPDVFTATGFDGSTVSFSATANLVNNDIMVIWNQTGTFGIPTGTYIPGDSVTGGGVVYYQGSVAGIVNQTGLNPMTIYFYKAFSVSGTQYSGGIADSAKTKCGNVTLPWSENFSVFPPDCWTRSSGILANPTTITGSSTLWIADGFGNIGTTGAAKINIYTTNRADWLITPSIDLGTGSANYQLEFDLALTAYASTAPPGTTGIDDKFAVVISTDNGATWTSSNTLRLWNNTGSPDVYNNISNTGEHIVVNLGSYTGVVKIGFYGESTISNADNDLFIDNISLYENLSAPSCATIIGPTDAATNVALNASISWNSVIGATSYDLFLGTNANPPFLINQTGMTYQPTPVLLPNTTYYWKVVPKNAIGDATGCIVRSFTTGTQITYCSSEATSTADDDIGNVTFAGINNGVETPVTPNPTSINLYTDFTAVSPAQVIAGGTYPISISQINSGTVYACLINVYIDVNNNGTFETNEKLFNATTSSTLTTVTGNVVIPANATISTTRMRIVMDESDIAPACDTYTWGETEDYMVTISAPPIPVADFTASITTPITNQVVAFTDLSTNFPTTWAWSFTPASVIFTGGTTAVSQNPQVQFTVAGNYTAQLIASNATGLDTAIKIDYIIVSDPTSAPVADFVAGSLNTFVNITDTLTDISTNIPTSWSWTITPGTFSYVDGTNSNSQNPHIQFTSTGVYTVELVAINGAGSDTMIKTDYIIVTLSYCISNLGGNGSCPGDITVVTIPTTTLNNTTHTNCSTANSSTYGSYPASGSNTAVLFKGYNYTMSVTTNANNIISMWIDYNQNGTFEATEWIQVCTSSVSGTANSVSFTVPISAFTGQTGLRIRSRLTSNPNAATDACTNFGSGITEDYLVNIVLPQIPVADFAANDVTPIINQVVTISDLTQNSPTSWQWYILPNNFGDFDYMNLTTATSQNPQVRFNVAGTWDVSLKATNLAGFDSIIKLAYITASIPTDEPIAGFITSNLNPTSLETVILTDTSLNTPTSWIWSFTPNTITYVDGTTASDQIPHVTFDAAGQYSVQLIAINGAGDDTAVYTNYITVTGVIIINDGTDTTCNSFFYDSGNISGQYQNSENYTLTIFPENPGDKVRVSFTAFDTENNYDSLSVYNGNSVAEPFLGKFQNTTLPPVITSTATDGSLTFHFSSDGSVVRDGWEAMFSCFTPLPPIAGFEADNFTPIIDQMVQFTDTSLNYPDSWIWLFDPNTVTFTNGTNANTQHPQVQFNAAGLYKATLIAANGTGSDTASYVDYINVIIPTNAPVADFIASSVNTNTFITDTLTDLSINISTSWSWTITPGSFNYVGGTNANSQNPLIQFTSAGVYTVELVATNGAGSDTMIKTDYITVTVNYCLSNATSTADDDLGNVTFAGINNGIATPALNNSTSVNTYSDFTSLSPAQVSIGASYPISIEQINSGATFYACSVKVYIDYNQNGNWDLPAELAFSGNTVTSGTPVTGSVLIPTNTIPGLTRMRVVLDETSAADPCGTYTWGETEDYTVQVITPTPIAGFYADNTNPFVDQLINLVDTSLNFVTTWSWSISPNTFTYENGTNATTQNPQVSFQNPGLYTVTLIASNAFGSDTAVHTDYINVVMPTNPPVAYFFANDTTATTAQIVSLTDTSEFTPTAWIWTIVPATFNYMNGTTANSQNPDVQFTAQGTYTVTLIASNAAGADTLVKVDYIVVVSSINMSNDTIVTCSSLIFDSGGQSGNYSDNEATTLVIQPAISGNVIQLAFSSFDVQPGWDYLNVYNGTGTAGTLLGTFDTPTLPPTLISTASDGALTLEFNSDASINAAGWDAYVNCIVPPVKSLSWTDTVFTESAANNGTIATVAVLSLTNETFASTGTFTDGVDYSVSNVPTGLSVQINATNVSTVTISLTGSAVSHTLADNISNLTVNFLDAAFSSGNAASINESSKSNLEVHFYDPFIIPEIVFSEIMYRSPVSGNNDSLEYIELFNYGTIDADLSNYTFSGIAYTIPNGTILSTGQYLVVAKNASAILNLFGVTALQWNTGATNNLSNTGEAVVLRTFWGATVDSVTYSSTAPWPTQAAGNGTSIALCDPNSDNTLAASWAASASVTTYIINAKTLTGSPGTDDVVCGVEVTANGIDRTSINVYPNPSNSVFNVKIKSQAISCKIELLNIDGKIIYKNEIKGINEFEDAIDLKAIASGVYFLKINTVSEVFIRKLIVQ